jgi:hypothetical protein
MHLRWWMVMGSDSPPGVIIVGTIELAPVSDDEPDAGFIEMELEGERRDDVVCRDGEIIDVLKRRGRLRP